MRSSTVFIGIFITLGALAFFGMAFVLPLPPALILIAAGILQSWMAIAHWIWALRERSDRKEEAR